MARKNEYKRKIKKRNKGKIGQIRNIKTRETPSPHINFLFFIDKTPLHLNEKVESEVISLWYRLPKISVTFAILPIFLYGEKVRMRPETHRTYFLRISFLF